jgi:signal recognition particle receptor subunit beta
MRSIWERYYNEANAVVFVVDSADVERLDEAKSEFLAICENELLKTVPILVIANKQDLPGALPPGDVGLHFYPVNDVADRTQVFPLNAIAGQGLEEAVNAIVNEATVNAKSRLP